MSITAAASTAPSFRLKDRTMLVSLTIKQWLGQRYDKDAAAETITANAAESDAGIFTTYLVPKKSLAAVAKANSRARQAFYRAALPWDEGVRIIPAERWESFAAEMETVKQEYLKEADRFAAVTYPAELARAQERLGGLYEGSSFPSASTIRESFDLSVTVLPVPDSEDFRCSVADAVLADIRQGIERHVVERTQAAQRDIWQRMLDVMRHFASTMKQDDKTFRDHTVGALAEVAAEAQSLSIIPDAQLDEVVSEFKAMAKAFKPEAVRLSPALRTKAAKQAAATVARIESMMGGAF